MIVGVAAANKAVLASFGEVSERAAGRAEVHAAHDVGVSPCGVEEGAAAPARAVAVDAGLRDEVNAPWADLVSEAGEGPAEDAEAALGRRILEEFEAQLGALCRGLSATGLVAGRVAEAVERMLWLACWWRVGSWWASPRCC